jgi:hypothetical protein
MIEYAENLIDVACDKYNEQRYIQLNEAVKVLNETVKQFSKDNTLNRGKAFDGKCLMKQKPLMNSSRISIQYTRPSTDIYHSFVTCVF